MLVEFSGTSLDEKLVCSEKLDRLPEIFPHNKPIKKNCWRWGGFEWRCQECRTLLKWRRNTVLWQMQFFHNLFVIVLNVYFLQKCHSVTGHGQATQPVQTFSFIYISDLAPSNRRNSSAGMIFSKIFLIYMSQKWKWTNQNIDKRKSQLFQFYKWKIFFVWELENWDYDLMGFSSIWWCNILYYWT